MRRSVDKSLVIAGQIHDANPCHSCLVSRPHMPVVYGRLYVEIARKGAWTWPCFVRRIPATLLADPLGQFLLSSFAIDRGDPGKRRQRRTRSGSFTCVSRSRSMAAGSGVNVLCNGGRRVAGFAAFWYLRGQGVGLTAKCRDDMAALVLCIPKCP